MPKRTPAEVYQALIAAGWPPAGARIMTAVAGGESGWRDDALGDTRLQDATWGPSVGAFQIRTLKRDTGTGSARDITALMGDLNAQAKAAWEISKHGTDFNPWTVYRTGRWKDFLGQVGAAIVGIPGAVLDKGQEVAGDVAGQAAGKLVDAVGGWLPDVRGVALEGAGGLLGLALIGAGLAAALSPRIRGRARALVGA